MKTSASAMVKTPDVAKKTKKRRAQTKKTSVNVRKKPSPEVHVVPVATYVEVAPPPRFATATPVNPPPCGNNLHRPLQCLH